MESLSLLCLPYEHFDNHTMRRSRGHRFVDMCTFSMSFFDVLPFQYMTKPVEFQKYSRIFFFRLSILNIGTETILLTEQGCHRTFNSPNCTQLDVGLAISDISHHATDETLRVFMQIAGTTCVCVAMSLAVDSRLNFINRTVLLHVQLFSSPSFGLFTIREDSYKKRRYFLNLFLVIRLFCFPL